MNEIWWMNTFFCEGGGTVRNGSSIVPDSLVDIQEIKESLELPLMLSTSRIRCSDPGDQGECGAPSHPPRVLWGDGDQTSKGKTNLK